MKLKLQLKKATETVVDLAKETADNVAKEADTLVKAVEKGTDAMKDVTKQ